MSPLATPSPFLIVSVVLGLTGPTPAQEASPKAMPRTAADRPTCGAATRRGRRGPPARAQRGLDPSPMLDVDGDLGESTLEALRRFQRARGLDANGVADAKTGKPWAYPLPRDEKVPPPEVVNAERPEKKPAEPLDGPPFVTAKAWVIVDGLTGAVVKGHREAEPLEWRARRRS